MKYIGSYILYLMFFGISLFWSWQYGSVKKSIKKRERKLYAVLITIPIIFIQGFRYDVGTDFLNYAMIYKEIDEAIKPFGNEILFASICRIVHRISSGNISAFFLVNAILMNVFLFLTFDYYCDQSSSITVMYFLYYMLCFPFFLNIEREGIAVIIVWYATRYLHEEKLSSFLFWILVATLIHNTAIIGLGFGIIYYISIKHKNFEKIILVGMLGCDFLADSILYILKNIELFSKYMHYMEVEIPNENISKDLIFFLVMMLLLIPMGGILKRSMINVSWLVCLCGIQLIAYLLADRIQLSFRLSFYSEIGFIFAYGYVVKNMKCPANKVMFVSLTIAAILFFFTYKYNIIGVAEIYPYHFVWQG